jgi:hypothetical protein
MEIGNRRTDCLPGGLVPPMVQNYFQHTVFVAFSDYPQDEIKAAVYFTVSRNKVGVDLTVCRDVATG